MVGVTLLLLLEPAGWVLFLMSVEVKWKRIQVLVSGEPRWDLMGEPSWMSLSVLDDL